VVEQIAIARGDRPQLAICVAPSAPESLVLPHCPSHQRFGEVVAQNIQTLRAIEPPLVGHQSADCRIEPSATSASASEVPHTLHRESRTVSLICLAALLLIVGRKPTKCFQPRILLVRGRKVLPRKSNLCALRPLRRRSSLQWTIRVFSGCNSSLQSFNLRRTASNTTQLAVRSRSGSRPPTYALLEPSSD
jgi:hypothetical protein